MLIIANFVSVPAATAHVFPMGDRFQIHCLTESVSTFSVAFRYIQRHLDPDVQPNFHFFNTFFFKKLTEKSGPNKTKAGTAHIASLPCLVLADPDEAADGTSICICRGAGGYTGG